MNGIIVHDEIDEHGGIIKNITGVDISQDTVAADNLLEGHTAHDREGNEVVGSYKPQPVHNSIGDTIVIGGELELETKIDGLCGLFYNVGTYEHDKLIHRDFPDQHPIDSITGLRDILDSVLTIDVLDHIYCGTSTEVI